MHRYTFLKRLPRHGVLSTNTNAKPSSSSFLYLNPPSSIPLNSLLLFIFGLAATCAGQTYSPALIVALGLLPSLQLQICVISGTLPPPMTLSLYHRGHILVYDQLEGVDAGGLVLLLTWYSTFKTLTLHPRNPIMRPKCGISRARTMSE